MDLCSALYIEATPVPLPAGLAPCPRCPGDATTLVPLQHADIAAGLSGLGEVDRSDLELGL